MRRWLPHPLLSVSLTLLWLLLVNELSPGALVLGGLLGWLIPLITSRFWPEHIRMRHPGVFARFLGVFIVDIVHGSFHVAWLILKGPSRLRPTFVEVPLDLTTELAISLLANTISLTPGTVSARLAADRRTLVVHTIDTGDPAALVAEIKARYEVPLKRVFETGDA